MASSEIHESESMLASPRAGTFTTSNVHAHSVWRSFGAAQELAVVVAVDRGHVPNRERRGAFVDNVETGTGLF
jgi:hypothetical protein